MREYHEKRIEVGYDRNPKKIFDELDSFIAQLIRAGWKIEDTTLDESLGFIDIIYYREITIEEQENSP